MRYVYTVIGRLIFAAITCLIVVIIAGGEEFLSQPLGMVYLVLLLLWMATLAIGRKTGVRSAYDSRQRGVYALLGEIASVLGMSLALSSLIGLAMTILLFSLLIRRMETEEEMLLAQFGNEYREYMQRTKRLIPGIY